MRVFVTGGNGFIGSEVVRTLTAAGHSALCLLRNHRVEHRGHRRSRLASHLRRDLSVRHRRSIAGVVGARRAAHHAGHSLGVRRSRTVATNLLTEFGPAGAIDTLVICADVLFYVPVIFKYERRKARSQ